MRCYRFFDWILKSRNLLIWFLIPLASGFAQVETWNSANIGAPSPTGSSSYDSPSDTFTIAGSGADIWGTSDQFLYVYQTLSGSGVIIARVGTVQNTNGWAKAGVMLRESTAAGSRHVLLAVTPSNGICFQRRLTTNGTTVNTSVGGIAAPIWLKLELRGDTVIASYSTNQISWTTVGTDTLPVTTSIEAGLAVTSHSPGVSCTATFIGVSLSAGSSKLPPSPWLDADVGAVPMTGSTLYDNGTFIGYGAGADIGSTADQFHYIYLPFTGDGWIEARLASQQNTNSWAKAGLMLRETLDTGARDAVLEVTPGNGIRFESRSAPSGMSVKVLDSAGTAPRWLRLERLGGLVRASLSDDGTQWIPAGEVNVPMGQQIYAGLPVTSHATGLSRATFDNVSVSPQPLHPLPQPWQQLDVGNLAAAGSGEYDDGTFTLYGSGADIWGSADAFHFASQSSTGDGVIVAHVTSVQNTNVWAKAGVMLRDSTSANSRHAMLVVTPGSGVSFQRRTVTGGSSTHTTIPGITVPVWLKLEHYGQYVTAFYSKDNVTWTYVAAERMGFASGAQAGLAVTSHNDGILCQASFDNVSLSTDNGVHGLRGSFYTDSHLGSLGLTRIDPWINFNWGTDYPDPLLPVDVFSVRWEGQILPRYSETYTFYTVADDGVRLWVNGQLVIDRWAAVSNATENAGTITLEANKRYDIKLEYYDAGYIASVRLDWASPSQPRESVPPQCLYPLDPNDLDYDGMPDAWEQQIVNASSTDSITSTADVLPNDDFDGDGLTNLQEYQQGTDPTDYYNGQLPNLTVLSGDNQNAESGILAASPVVIRVTNSSGDALANAPVHFTASTSGAGFSATSDGGSSLLSTLDLRTNPDGTVSVYVAPSGEKGSTSTFQITATSNGQTQTATFTAVVQSGKLTPQIAGGSYHTLALRSDGTLWAWGYNSVGEFGNGTTTSSPIPVKINSSIDGHIVAVAAGSSHSMALTDDGKVWTWGANWDGEIGDGTQSADDALVPLERLQPGPVNGLNETTDDPVIAIAAGSVYSLALKKDGSVWEWGVHIGLNGTNHLEASRVVLADGTPLANITAISAEGYHALALRNDGTVWAWGQNASGELGDGTTTTADTPVEVVKADGSPLTGISDVRAGNYFSVALDKSRGEIWAWGNNFSGVLGDGTNNNSTHPIKVIGFGPQNPAIAIEAKGDFCLALTSDRRVWTWGYNFVGQLGNGTITYTLPQTPPLPAPILNDIIGMSSGQSSGGSSGYAIDLSGRIWSWGSWWVSGRESVIHTTLPAIVTTDIDGLPFGSVKELSLDPLGDICVALQDDGSVWTSGTSTHAEMGDKTNIATSLFFRVPGIPNTTRVSVGQSFALALDGSQTVWAWGDYPFLPGNSRGPAQIKDASGNVLGNITSISAGWDHALALDGSGQVWAWGGDSVGQIGNGTQSNGSTGVTHITTDGMGAAFGNVVEISAGCDFSLARKSGGSVWTWGAGTTRPTQISSLSNIVAISAGYTHSVALDSNNKVWTWGDNTYGEMGSAATGQSSVSTPVQISELNQGASVVSVRAYKWFSLALKSDGTVWGWGHVPQKGGVTQSAIPFQLEGYEGIKALANTSTSQAFAIKNDGTLIISAEMADSPFLPGPQKPNCFGVGGVISAPAPLLIDGLNLLVESPQVTISSPGASATAAWGTPITIQTSTSGRQVGKIDFYNEDAWIGSSTSSAFLWQPPTWGVYHLRAIVTTADGLTSGYSNSVELTVPYNPNWNNPGTGSSGDPNTTDSDGDGVSDAQEIAAGTDPYHKDNTSLNLDVNVILK